MQLRRVAQVEHRSVAAREHCGHPATVLTQRAMPDGKYPSMQAVQPAYSNAMVDGAVAQARSPQLRSRDDTVLSRGNGGDSVIDGRVHPVMVKDEITRECHVRAELHTTFAHHRDTFCAHVAQKVTEWHGRCDCVTTGMHCGGMFVTTYVSGDQGPTR